MAQKKRNLYKIHKTQIKCIIQRAALNASSAHKKFRLARKKINAYSIHQPARYG